ncbi:MAG: S41 family peptidase [Alphaproteobacteria bacterium]|nr:S41 family peptidase [Alphaproteobacteria bacterium]
MNRSLRFFLLGAGSAVLVLAALAAGVTIAAPEQAVSSKMLALYAEVFNEVRANYVKPVSDKKLVEGSIQGMLSNLDPHSSYMDAKEFKEMMVQTRGEFGGLGMQVTMDNGLVKVVSPIDDTPAAKAGILPGDLIVAIDNAPVTDMTLSQAVDKLRGPIGSHVTLTMRRQGAQPFELTLTRADIKVDPVKSRLVDGNIGYIRVATFSERTGSALASAIKDLRAKSHNKLAGVVLDLRNNPGGLLDEAVTVSNTFIAKGEIVSIKGRVAADTRRYNAEASKDMVPGDVPMVVLINGGSASASEIVAGALQDTHRAVIMGTRSFGKGSVQTILPVKGSGGAIRLTTALYYTPSGRSIQGTGIKPDVVVPPAKIEKIALGPVVREEDLKGAFKNPDGHAAAAPAAPANDNAPAAKPAAPGAAAKPDNLPPGAKPVPLPANAALEPNLVGTDSDYQFVRAVDLLRGLALFRSEEHTAER